MNEVQLSAPPVESLLGFLLEVRQPPLEGKQRQITYKLLNYLRRNPTFFSAVVAEAFWLKKRGRPGAGKALFHFLRGAKRLHGVDEFALNNDLFPLLTRMVLLLFPVLNNGMFELRPCEADVILSTSLAAQTGKKKRVSLLQASDSLRDVISTLPLTPVPPEVKRRSTRHVRVKPEEAALTLPFIKELVKGSPHPRGHILGLLLRHARTQPEIFALVVRRLKARSSKRRGYFSIHADFEYAKRTVQRGTDQEKSFTLSGKIEALYCRAALRLFPQFNGWTLIKTDSAGRHLKGRANALLGCYIAPAPVNGEPHPRLLWLRDELAR